jgi:beta-galactosidase
MSRELLTVAGDQFLRGGRPHQVISGGIHYFRIHPDLWEDRLLRLRAMGLNTVETYVAWNVHERVRGELDFTGGNDLARFVGIAADLGLDVILRPGPYICAEWDFGGLPGWLMAEPGIRLRCMDDRYLAAVDAWFDALVPVMVPLLAPNGGPVVAVQVENEYGSYGDDREYLEWCRTALTGRGIDVLLVTSDGPGPDYLASGTIPGVLATANFGSRPEAAFGELRAHRADGPIMCMEYWNGWFDHWGFAHHRREPHEAAQVLDTMLKAGASVNLYMAHGGTNFGLWNGANVDEGVYLPTVTSYDYDAPVGESGELTPKFHAFRDVISSYAAVPAEPLPATPARLSAQSATVDVWAPLLDRLAAFAPGSRSAMPQSMEDLGQDHGLVLYRGSVLVPPEGGELVLDGLVDRAIVLADGVPLGVVSRNDAAPSVRLAPRADGLRTSIGVLVENQGRVNFGPGLGERKGLTAVRLGNRFVHDWESIPLRLDDPDLTKRLVLTPSSASALAPAPAAGPVFATSTLTIDAPADGFVALPEWTKGFVWLNGFLLGRYWAIGPQLTLYAPAPLWREGANEIVVLELHAAGSTIELAAEPDLGPPGTPGGS